MANPAGIDPDWPDMPDYYPRATNAILGVSLSRDAYKKLTPSVMADILEDTEVHPLTQKILVEDLVSAFRLAFLDGYFKGSEKPFDS